MQCLPFASRQKRGHRRQYSRDPCIVLSQASDQSGLWRPNIGKAREIGFAQAGDVVGDVGVLNGTKHFAFVQALTASEVLHVPRVILNGMTSRSSSLARRLDAVRVDEKKDSALHGALCDSSQRCDNDLTLSLPSAHRQPENRCTRSDEDGVFAALKPGLDAMGQYRLAIKTNERQRWRAPEHLRSEDGGSGAFTHRACLEGSSNPNLLAPLRPAMTEDRDLNAGALSFTTLVSSAKLGGGKGKLMRAINRKTDFDQKMHALRSLMKAETCSEPTHWNQLQELLENYPQSVNHMGRSDKYSLLHMACLQGVPQLCMTLLAHGAEVNQRTNVGETSLHLALRASPEFQVQLSDGSLSKDRLQVLRLLLAHNAVVQCDAAGLSPLDLVGHEVPRLLLQGRVNDQLSACALPGCMNRRTCVLCSHCQLAMYCSADHAQQHWSVHQLICRTSGREETAQGERASNEVLQRISHVHGLLNLCQKGLNFIRHEHNSDSSKDQPQEGALMQMGGVLSDSIRSQSLFDQERTLTSAWRAWMRAIWVQVDILSRVLTRSLVLFGFLGACL